MIALKNRGSGATVGSHQSIIIIIKMLSWALAPKHKKWTSVVFFWGIATKSGIEIGRMTNDATGNHHNSLEIPRCNAWNDQRDIITIIIKKKRNVFYSQKSWKRKEASIYSVRSSARLQAERIFDLGEGMKVKTIMIALLTVETWSKTRDDEEQM